MNKRGFTIPELTIAMSFLSMLLIVLLLSTMNFIAIYNKGITLKRVNQSGTAIGAAMQKSLRGSTKYQTYTVGAGKPITRLCTGRYSYAWSLHANNGASIIVETKYKDDGSLVGFAKMLDVSQSVCAGGEINKGQATEMLGDGLVVKSPTVVQSTADNKLVSFIYTLSTPNSDAEFADPPTGGPGRGGAATCQGGKSNGDDFCALNTFVITSHTGYNDQ